jgi:hypothetical protein
LEKNERILKTLVPNLKNYYKVLGWVWWLKPIILATWNTETAGSWFEPNTVPAHKKVSKILSQKQNQKRSQAWCHMPVFLANPETEVGRF